MFDIPLQNSLETDAIVVLVLAFLAGLGLIYWGFRTYRIGRLIRDTPTEKVRSVAVGRTELEGTAIPDEFILDRPFTEGKCLYASYTIKEYREDHSDNDNNNNNKEWKTILSNTVAAPFYLDDGTGQIFVDADSSATFEISDEYTDEIRVNGTPPAKVQEFLSGTGGAATGAMVETMSNIMGSVGGFGGGGDSAGGPPGDATTAGGTADASTDRQQPADAAGEGQPQDAAADQSQVVPDIVRDEEAMAALEEMDEQEMEAIQRGERDPPPELEPYTGEEGDISELFGSPANIGQFVENGLDAALDAQTSSGDDADEQTVTHIPRSDLNSGGSVLDSYDDDDPAETQDADDSDDSLLGKVKSTASTVSEFASGGGVSDTHRKRRYKQEVLPVEEDTYVYGAAKQRDVSMDAANQERVTIGEDEGTGEFIVSDYGESEIASAYTKRAILFILGGLVVSAGSLGILVNGMGL
jgi:hypothetical protein